METPKRLQKKMKKSLSVTLHWITAFSAASAHAARPFVTDDARIVERGHCQIETFYKRERAYSGSEFWFMPACNPSGIEITAGANRVEDEHSLVLQGKTLLKPLETNGSGYALSVGTFRVNPHEGRDVWSPYLNGIGSFSFMDDRTVIHANLGAIRDGIEHMTRPTWGLGLEALLIAPRLYGIAEMFGQRADKPTRHLGLRYWIVPNRVQVDTSVGEQNTEPARRFTSLGLRLLF
jgi:hypothetical protein